MGFCRTCKYWLETPRECTNEYFVRENLNEVSGWGEMMTDIMMQDAGVNTFGTPPDYSCGYYERAVAADEGE
jgi:hypothetical protein